MMATATLGELLRAASGHLAATGRFSRTRPPAEAMAAATWQASRVAIAMSRYLDDIVPYSRYEAVITRDMEPWMRAAVDAREALEMAATSLRPDAGNLAGAHAPDAAADPLVAHLTAAATSLAAGCDLLRSHFATDIDGIRMGHSDWSAVITSVPFTHALLEEIARWSQQLSLMTARLTPASAKDSAVPAPVHHGLVSACHWLLTAGVTLTAWQRNGSVTPADTRLLLAVPDSSVPERQPPEEAEPISQLCDGVAVSAVRMRAIARQTVVQAAMSPTTTAASWRWTATAAAVICHISELTLTAAAERASHTTGQPAVSAQLRAAAAAAEQACTRWREVAAAWKQMTTETTGLDAPGVADTGDLVVRLGRLASGDPQWTPSRSHRIQLRRPADLVRSQARAAAVVAAVHQSADALACVATADMHAVDYAARAGRLYVPTRTLPEFYDVPRPFGNATPVEVADLLGAYLKAAGASTQAATALDAVAVTLDTPSRVLAAARAAAVAAEGASAPRPTSRRNTDTPGTVPDLSDYQASQQPDSVEQAVRRLGAPDPVYLLRAAAIDKAARTLIAEAEQSALQRRATRDAHALTRQGPGAPRAAQLAAESFPGPRATSTSGQQPGSHPTPADPRAPRRTTRQGSRRLR
jgi:hypothetical protein